VWQPAKLFKTKIEKNLQTLKEFCKKISCIVGTAAAGKTPLLKSPLYGGLQNQGTPVFLGLQNQGTPVFLGSMVVCILRILGR